MKPRATVLDRPRLSKREWQVLELLAKGMLYKEAGAQLGIARKTVDNHCVSIARKLNVHGPLALHDFAQSFQCAAILSDPSRK